MCSYALTGTSSKGHSSERVSSLSCAMKINGMTKWYGVSTIDIDFTIEKTKQKHNKKSTSPLTAHASATTCMGTGKSVGVLCKTAQK